MMGFIIYGNLVVSMLLAALYRLPEKQQENQRPVRGHLARVAADKAVVFAGKYEHFP